MKKIDNFKIQMSADVIQDLKNRLARTRWSDEISGADWDYGTNLSFIKNFVAYWQIQFDWSAQEKILNSFAHYRTTIDGLGIHFIYERGKGPIQSH